MPRISEECQKCISYKNGDCFGEPSACADYKYSPQMTESEKEAWPYVMGSSRFSTHFEWKKEFEKRAKYAEEKLATQAKKTVQTIPPSLEEAAGIQSDIAKNDKQKTTKALSCDIYPGIITRSEDICKFFGKNDDVANLFFALYDYLHNKDSEIIARFNGSVLGLSLENSKYLLYFSHTDEGVYVKFGFKPKRELASVSNIKEYYSNCDRILESDYRPEVKTTADNNTVISTEDELDVRVEELKNLIQELPKKVALDDVINRENLYISITRRFDRYKIKQYKDLIEIDEAALRGLATLSTRRYDGLVRFLSDPRRNECKKTEISSGDKTDNVAGNLSKEDTSEQSDEGLKKDFWNEVKYLFAESERLNMMYEIGANSQLCEYIVKTLEYVVRRSAETIPTKEYSKEEYEEELNSIIHKAHREKTARELKELIMEIPIEQYYQVILFAGKTHSYIFNALVEISSD